MTTAEVLDAIARERERLMNAVDALGQRAAGVRVTEEGSTAKDDRRPVAIAPTP